MLSVLKEIRDLLKKQAPIPELPDKKGLIKLEMKDYMTAEWLVAECKKKFSMWISGFIDLKSITSERKGNYTVYFKDVQEADEENKNKSVNDLKERGHKGITLKGITLEERLALELVYFEKHGKHLDEDNTTLCSGSQHSDGDVPGVGWYRYYRGLEVQCWHAWDRHSNLRSRSVVKIEK